jgi:hypothetical protein
MTGATILLDWVGLVSFAQPIRQVVMATAIPKVNLVTFVMG